VPRPAAAGRAGAALPPDPADGEDEAEPIPGSHEPLAHGPFELPPGARLERDLAYGNDPRQRLDVYRPAPGADLAPVLFMVHGGGWTRGNKALWRVVRNKVEHWVGKGYLLVSTNYRLVPDVDPLTQAEDVGSALAFVQSRLAGWGADPARMTLVGHSAGGHLLALMNADPSIARHRGAKGWRAVVSLDCGAMDIEKIMLFRHFPLYNVAFSDDRDYWRRASPFHRITGPLAAPMLLVYSTRRPDSGPQANAFAAKAATVGSRVDLLPIDLQHGLVNDLLGSPGVYTDAVDRFLASTGMP
jgi:acetyl esterase/lipase